MLGHIIFDPGFWATHDGPCLLLVPSRGVGLVLPPTHAATTALVSQLELDSCWTCDPHEAFCGVELAQFAVVLVELLVLLLLSVEVFDGF